VFEIWTTGAHLLCALRTNPPQGQPGVARALTGKYAKAAADFQPYVNAAPDVTRRGQRKAWIETLKKNENPITPEVIKELLGQSLTPGPKP
jgi:hypothetical protein